MLINIRLTVLFDALEEGKQLCLGCGYGVDQEGQAYAILNLFAARLSALSFLVFF